MNHSHAPSPHQGVYGKFVHDAKETALTSNGTSHDPHASHRHTPDLESESDGEGTTSCEVPNPHTAIPPPRILVSSDDSIVTNLDQTGPHVRFRSRVRISAGIGRRRRRFSDGLSSGGSSISGSPSSSISAPLRTHYTGNNGWLPLGSRVKQLLASQEDAGANGAGKGDVGGNGVGNARRRSSWLFLDDDADEHTRLLASATRHSYAGRYVRNSYHSDDDSEREGEQWWRERLIDEMFGKWPGRLLNRHWWWWHLEPILCCFCGPDDEE